MTRSNLFSGIPEFLAVSYRLSFRAAAADLRVSPAAVSQAIKSLESRLKLPLFQRTTRRVTLTEAGAELHRRLKPATNDIADALEALGELRSRPTGRLRLSVPRIALDLVVLDMVPEFRRRYPDIEIEFDVNDESVDVVGREFDAGIRIGEFIERDMVAVKITPPFRWVVVGSPDYFAEHGRPKLPKDLMRHECIRYRFPTAQIVYQWQFVTRGREYALDPPGGVVVNDHMAMVALAKRGMGLAYTADLIAAPWIVAGELDAVLAPHLPTRSGLYLYFAKGSQLQPKLRAFIDAATARFSASSPASRNKSLS